MEERAEYGITKNYRILVYLENNKAWNYEEKNSFNHGKWPCFYNKTEVGSHVVFHCTGSVFDLSVFDSKGNMVSFISDLKRFVNKENVDVFFDELLQKDYSPGI